MNFKLIVLEGIDCCGKTTAAEILTKSLQPSVLLRFPDRNTKIGAIINQFLRKDIDLSPNVAHLLFSANRYENAKIIKKMLETSHVICDRYWLSGTVYSTAKGLDYDWCKQIDKELPQPDFSFFINVDPKITTSRKSFGLEAHDKIEFQKKVYKIYNEKSKSEKLIHINGEQTSEMIVADIIQYLKNK